MVEEGLVVKFKGEGGQLTKTLGDLQGQLRRFQTALQSASNVESFNRIQRAIDATKQRITQLNNIGNPFNRATVGANHATQSLVNLSRIAQDAPYGFIGIANNLNPMLESFQRLRAETGSNGSALKAMAQGLIGPAGLGLALGVVSSLLVQYGDNIAEAFSSLDKASGTLLKTSDAIAEAKNEYTKAVVSVDTLREHIELARQGFISKKGVVNEYNETIGKTTGKVHSLDEAEKALTKNANAYIQFTLLKAAANVALEKAAQKAFEAEEQRRKPKQEFSQSFGDFLSNFNLTPVTTGKEIDKRQKDIDEALDRSKEKTVHKLQGEGEEFKKIAEGFNTQAAQIAKDFHFDFFDGQFDDKGKRSDQFNFFDKFFDVNPKTATDKAKQAVSMYETAMDFALKNQNIFFGLDKIINAGSQDKVIEKGKEFWAAYQKGLVKFKPSQIDIQQEISLVPTIKTEDPGLLIDQYLKGLAQEQNKGEGKIDLPLQAEVKFNDFVAEYQRKFKELGRTAPDVKGLAKPLEDLPRIFNELDKRIHSTASTVSDILAPAFSNLFSSIVSNEPSLQSFFDSIKNALNQLIQKLVKAALQALVLSALTPGGGGFINNFKGALGLSHGGLVPGSGNTDSVPAMLTPGEFVLSKDMIARIKGGNLSVLPKVLGNISATLPATPNFKGLSSTVPAISTASITQGLSSVKPVQVRTEAPDYIPIMRGDQLLLMNNRAGRKQGRVS